MRGRDRQAQHGQVQVSNERSPISVARLQRNAFVIVALAACAALQVALLRTQLASDSWFSVLAGRTIARHGLPHHDALASLSLGRTWVDQEWLGHLFLYGLWQAGRWPLVLLVVVVLYTGAFAICALAARTAGASEGATALLIVLCFLAGLGNTTPRAQIPAYCLFALVFSLLLADARQPTRMVWLVIPCLILWANVHGSVILGAGLVALRGLSLAATSLRQRAAPTAWLWRAVILVVAPWACVLASPYGFSLPGYYRRVLDNHELSKVVGEWGPSTLHGEPLFFVLVATVIGVVTWGRMGVSLFAFLSLVATGILGLLAIRNVVWFALAAAAVAPAALSSGRRRAISQTRADARKQKLNLAIAATMVVFALVVAGTRAAQGNAWFEQNYPPAAGDAVAAAAAADPSVRIFSDEQWADWLLFEHPSLDGRVAFDIRYELLTTAQITRIADFRLEQGPGWLAAIRPYGILVLDPVSDKAAIRLLIKDSGTRVLFRSKETLVLRQKTAEG